VAAVKRALFGIKTSGFLVLGFWYLVFGIWLWVLGFKFLVFDIWFLVFGF
jgi:hypothetical protein